MKLPRWVVVSLLSGIALGVVSLELLFARWWVKWPERTACEFVEIMGSMRYEELPRFIPHNWQEASQWDGQIGSPNEARPDYARAYTVEAKPFTWFDYLRGRRQFIVRDPRSFERYLITVSRGTVIEVDVQMRGNFNLPPGYPITVWFFLAEQSGIHRQ